MLFAKYPKKENKKSILFFAFAMKKKNTTKTSSVYIGRYK